MNKVYSVKLTSYEIFLLMQLLEKSVNDERAERIARNDCRYYEFDNLRDSLKLHEKLDFVFEQAKREESKYFEE